MSFCNNLRKIADSLDAKGKFTTASKIDKLIKQIVTLSKDK